MAQTVRMRTNMGDIDVQLLPESAPATVQNFLNYMNRGAFNNTFFHRSVRGFVIQAGGFTFRNDTLATIAQDPPVRNEYRISNTRGTIAMAKLGTDPNSATNQWFFNLGDNAANLNNQNGGFTVFGRITGANGLAVMDRMANVPIYNAGDQFDSLPLQNFTNGQTVREANLVLVQSMTILTNLPAISERGVITAANFGAAATAAPGSYIEIYGSNFVAAGTTREWGNDFRDGVAPTSLAGVTVSVDGRTAFVSYVSPSQINVQVPSGVATTRAVPVVVTSGGFSSTPITIDMRPTAGALLAPPSYKVGDRQFAFAARADGSFITRDNPAVAGETVIFYGVGFGPVTTSATAHIGRVAAEAARTTSDVGFRVNDIPCATLYSGLAPGFVGLYQFNVTVPPESEAGELPLAVLVNLEATPQTLFLPVRRP